MVIAGIRKLIGMFASVLLASNDGTRPNALIATAAVASSPW